jgi:hypothetical protein
MFYNVTIERLIRQDIIVAAADEDEAREIVMSGQFSDDDIAATDEDDTEILKVEEYFPD